MSGFSAEGVAVDECEKWCQASLSVPGAAVVAAVDAVAILHSGPGITTMPAGIANKLQAAFPDVQVVGGMAHPGKCKVADGRVLVVTGANTAAYPQCRCIIISADAFQRQQCGTPEELNVAVERLVARGPDIDMGPEEELRARSESLEGAVLASVAAGLDESHVERLRDVIGKRWNAFQCGLRRGDLPALVELLRVTLKSGAWPVRARPRVYNPVKTTWLAACTASSAALALVFFDMQAAWASAAMAMPKKGGFCLVRNFRAANQRVEKVPGEMPNQEASMAKPSNAQFYGSLVILQGYWQSPLAPEAEEIFTIATPGGLYTPRTRVPQGILNATSYFQAMLTRVLEGLDCMVCMDDVLYWGLDDTDLFNTLEPILARLEEVGLYAAAHKCTFFETSITWCGKD